MWRAKYEKSLTMPSGWQQLPNGSAYCNALSDYFAPWLTKICGYQILKIGGLSAEITCDLPLRHQISVNEKTPPNLTALLGDYHSVVQSKLTELPFIEQHIDACILTNTLNFVQDPHQVLRETHRVLADDGYLFLSLFNPLSTFMFKTRLGEFPLRHYCAWRIADWLELLNFEILEQQNLALNERQSGWFSPLIVMVAQKRTYPLILNPKKVRSKIPAFLQPAEALKAAGENP
ncbi:class I SAM-dependent methyltransferase [Aggregatibacter actinomycetemcomitans]|uniref:class I SAM-dependent methyltransferase n=1 Tax=Aggregatibacter actinomycetemcomitans TaxID=714 RepID=UPI0006808F57|nr:methyltransferase domain-containing protein [Aggregatibacter actinomycetemcomitans]TQE41783.1 SAM-dependent methyltransferase [Aggregatibacter actinomycetemcomitans]